MQSWNIRMAAWVCGIACVAAGPRVAADDPDAARAALSREAVARWDRENLDRFGEDPEVLLRPGLRADRRAGRVWFQALATQPDYPVEFFVVGERSGHDYEALTIALARPWHIHEGLAFLGVRPGRPVNFERLELWPRGDRVHMTFHWEAPREDASGAERRSARAEDLVVDLRTGEGLPSHGFVFAGSRRMPPAPGEEEVYIADAFDPFSIASNYNEPYTVLDMPWRVSRGEIYEHLMAHSSWSVKAGTRVEIELEPRNPIGHGGPLPLRLEARPGKDLNDYDPAALRLRLLDPEGNRVHDGNTLVSVLAHFERVIAAGHDPFVRLEPDPALRLEALRRLCALLEGMTGPGGLRLEPPREGDLFYRAFLPDPRYRERERRPAMAWELALASAADGAVTGMLYRLAWDFGPEELPAITEDRYPLDRPETLRSLLDRHGPGVPVILIFAPQAMSYGRLTAYTRAARATHPTVYVFMLRNGESGREIPDGGADGLQMLR